MCVFCGCVVCVALPLLLLTTPYSRLDQVFLVLFCFVLPLPLTLDLVAQLGDVAKCGEAALFVFCSYSSSLLLACWLFYLVAHFCLLHVLIAH